jgi:hypothetical protein
MNLPKFVLSGVRRVLPALLLGSVAVSLSAWAGPKQVPFKARISAQEVLGFDPVRCPIPEPMPEMPLVPNLGTTTGKGTASHMGAVKMVATDCPVLTDMPPSFSDGRLTLTAANGDEVHAAYQGVLVPADETGIVFRIVGGYTVNGGTGRFTNATGSGTLGGTITLVPGGASAEYEVKGTLSY